MSRDTDWRPEVTTVTKPVDLTEAEAKAMRRRLAGEGYASVAGSGRGVSWTRHTKGDRTVFVQKPFGEPRWYWWAIER
jgi:hypothetical protein